MSIGYSKRRAGWPITSRSAELFSGWEQALWVENVLRAVCSKRPAAALVKLDSEKIADFPVDTIAHTSKQFSLRVFYPYLRAQRDRLFHLDASSRKGNILEVRHEPPQLAGLVSPNHLEEIST